MNDQNKTKKQLINELIELRQKITELTEESISLVRTSAIDRKQTEEALRESENKFRDLAEKSLIGVYLIQSGVFKYVNPRLAGIFGYTVKELVDKKTKDLTLPEDWPIVEENFRKRLSGEVKSIHYNIRGITKNKEVIYVEIYGSRTVYQGQPAIIGTLLDITERKRAEETLRESEKRYRELWDNAPVAYHVLNTKGIITDVNQTEMKMLGYAPEEMVGKSIFKFILPEQRAKARKRFRQKVSDQHIPRTEDRIYVKKDGSKIYVVIDDVFECDSKGEVIEIKTTMVDITELKQAEKALKESEEKFRTLVETSADLVFQLSQTGRINYVSSRVKALYGYEPEELIGKHLTSTTPAKEVPRAMKALRTVLTGKPLRNFGIRQIVKGGRIIPMEINATPMRKGKKIVGLQGIMRDITERKRVEEALHASEAKFRNIVESSPLGMHMYHLESDGRLVFVGANNAADRILGVDNNQFIGKTIEEAFPPLVATEIPRRYRHAAAQGESWSTEQLFYEDGKIAGVFEVYAFQTEPNKMVAMFNDVTERKETERKLKESEAKFRSLIEQSNDGIYVLQDDRFVFINSRYTAITGYKLEEISGEDFNFRDMVAEEGIKVIDERLKKKKRRETLPDRYIFQALRKDGQKRELEVSVTTINWQDKPATLGIVSDVTERIKTRKKLEEALEQAKQANKVKSLFLANMSHEIRTPLNAILGFTDLIKRSTQHLLGPEEKTFFETIERSGERLMNTVHEILDISQVEAGAFQLNLKPFYLSELVEKLVAEFKPMAWEKRLELDYHTTVRNTRINADSYCISQALSGLIENAIKYTKKGRVDISLNRRGNKLLLIIKDTGIGISDEYQEHLFELFSQESMGYTKKFQGVGLGLALTKHYLDMNHVGVDVNSTKDIGTTFTLTFKLFEKKSAKDQIRLKNNVPVDLEMEPDKKHLVLVVEDNVSSQNLVKFFTKEIYNLLFAVSVREAKELLKNNPVELILLDLSLIGDEDGLDLARYLRKTKKWKELPIIATTAHAFETDRDNVLAAGCNDYLTKPIKQQELLKKLNDIFN